MTIGDIQVLEVQIPREIIQYWGWFLAFGIGVLVLGIAAVVRAVTATVASMLFFGWLLVLASGIEIAQAVMVGHWAGFFQHLLAAILFGITGLLMVMRPRDQRRGRDGLYGDVFLDWRAVSTCRLGGGCVAGLGLAGGGWNHHICAGPARPCANGRPRDFG